MSNIPFDLVPLGVVFGHPDGPRTRVRGNPAGTEPAEWPSVEALTAKIDDAFASDVIVVYGRRPGRTDREIIRGIDYEIDWLGGPSLRPGYFCEVRARRRGLADYVGPWLREFDQDLFFDLAVSRAELSLIAAELAAASVAPTLAKLANRSRSKAGRKPGSGATDDEARLKGMRALLTTKQAPSKRAAAISVTADLAPQNRRDAAVDRLRKKYTKWESAHHAKVGRQLTSN